MVRIHFLGGLGEIGRNCMAIEISDEIVLVDAGILFPDSQMLGVDLVLPDLSFIRENAARIRGVVLTHGHEDHIGALPYILREIDSLDIYGTELTLGILRPKLEEHRVDRRANLIICNDREKIETGPFAFQFIPVAHSVPNGCGIAFTTPQGTVIHSGDFKIDNTPIDGRMTDLTLLGDLGNDGVRLLLSDSTNAEEPGWIRSERTVGKYLRGVFNENHDRRIIAACFASHLHRVQQLVDAAIDSGRRVAFLGRSMISNVATARDLGVLEMDERDIIDISDVKDLDPGRVCVICTGSQGEPLSALALMAAHEHKHVAVRNGDLVLFSSHPIPGNESDVHRVIDGLFRAGADVLHSGISDDVHVSGHGAAEDLKTMLNVVRPEWFIPIHGEFRHLVHHARLAEEVGVPHDHVLVAEDGDVVELTDSGVAFADFTIPAGYFYVDGTGLGDVNNEVLRDRRVLSEEGFVLVVVTVDSHDGSIVSGPEIITRGWVGIPESEELLNDARERVIEGIREAAEAGATDWNSMKRHIRSALDKFIRKSTNRRPVVIPVVMEV